MFVRSSYNMEYYKHVFMNFNFENDLSQLPIDAPMLSSNLYMQYLLLERHPFQTVLKCILRIGGNCTLDFEGKHCDLQLND